jgi:hypothetical protein
LLSSLPWPLTRFSPKPILLITIYKDAILLYCHSFLLFEWGIRRYVSQLSVVWVVTHTVESV